MLSRHITTSALIPLVIAATLLAGCGIGKVSDKQIEPIDIVAVRKQLASDPDRTVLVDARSPAAFAAGHIPGAVNIPVNEARSRDPKLESAKTIIVYGNGWQDDLPRVLAKRLMLFGYGNVYVFTGGIETWNKNPTR